MISLYFFTSVAACLFWVLIHLMVASRTDTFHLFIALFTACGLYIYSEACHVVLESGSSMDTIATITGMLAGPSVIPLLITYLRRLMHSPRSHPITVMWVVIPAALFTAGTVLSLLNSKEADELFHTITVDIYNMILAIELVILLVFIIIMLRQKRLLIGTLLKFFMGQKISLARLQMSVAMIPMGVMAARIGFGYNLYALDLWVQITTATLLLFSALLFGLNALFGSKVNISWKDYRLLIRYNYGKQNKDEVVEAMLNDLLDEAEEEALRRIQEKIGENLHIEEWHAEAKKDTPTQLTTNIFTAVSDSWDENSLISRFQHLMMDEHLFLHPRLTLDDVAERLNSNKTYVSKLVNNTYNLGFPELINTLRIDYAEQYILSHREAKQEEIAQSCGFLSASSFNTTFKKVTGMTPKVWIASMERQKVKE